MVGWPRDDENSPFTPLTSQVGVPVPYRAQYVDELTSPNEHFLFFVTYDPNEVANHYIGESIKVTYHEKFIF